MAVSYAKPELRSPHMTRSCFSWILKEEVLIPEKFTSEAEKEQNTHYIYLCTKNDNWEQIYEDNYEKCLKDMIL